MKNPHKLYPFQNQSFDEVVDSYLPVLNQLDNKNKENFFNLKSNGLHMTVPGPPVSDHNVCKMKIVKVKGLFKGTYSLLPQMKAQFGERNFFIFLDLEFRIDAMLVTYIGYKLCHQVGDTNCLWKNT